jgi:hypothetical protein
MAPSYTQPLWLYRTLIPPDVKGLMSWDLSAWSSWGIEVRYSRGKAKSVSISEPVDGSTRCKSFRHGQRLVFPPVLTACKTTSTTVDTVADAKVGGDTTNEERPLLSG